MANRRLPVNMKLIIFGSLDQENEEKCLTLVENGQRTPPIFWQILSAKQSRHQQAHGGNRLVSFDPSAAGTH